MKIVFVTTCKNRAFHLGQTLPKNLAGNPRSTFIVLDYGSRDNLATVLDPYRDSANLSVYNYNAAGAFHMAHAKNLGHRLGMVEGADVLVNLDADNYLGDGFEDFVAANFRSDSFLWSGLVKGHGRKLRGVSGRIAVTPNAFIKTGGYDEKYSTWAPDDKDFNNRLRYLGYRAVEIDRKYLSAIPHGNGLRFQEYPHAQAVAEGEDTELAPLKTGVVNFGRFGVGDVFRRDGSSVRIHPLPTRIFGVGLHKTATTSLHAALQILGYDSAHWESGNWARDVWDEMRADGKSPSLEKFYAASDLPISILYKELDRGYPGSKFILTIRDEATWLRSVRDHLSYKNPYRWEWDVFPISNRIHQAVYGRKDFDYDTFRERYRRHNAEVIDYFKDRPNDLLVMREPRWEELCAFLGRSVPNVEYPKKFVTGGGANGSTRIP